MAPLTSTPIMGTNAKKMKEIENKGITSFISNSVLITEIIIIIDSAANANNKCLVKKK